MKKLYDFNISIQDISGDHYPALVNKTAQLFDYQIENPIYIELWSEEDFREYFSIGNIKIINPITEVYHKPNGFHQYGITKEHEIAIIMNNIWRKTLYHELMHCYQSEVVGKIFYDQIAELYRDDRLNDPFEVQAELYAINKIKELG